MRLYSLFLLLFTTLCYSCIKEPITMDRQVTINACGQHITMIRYLRTSVIGQQLFTSELAAGVTQADTVINGQIAEAYDQRRFTLYDSIKVVFNHRDTITHYPERQEHFAGTFYLFSSTRNLMNINSYAISSTENKKRQFRSVSYTYTFTEQDYEDAKK